MDALDVQWLAGTLAENRVGRRSVWIGEDVERPEVGVEREVGAVLERLCVEDERQAGRSAAERGVELP